jgi:hypothetical protein
MAWKPWSETVPRPLTEADAHAEAWGKDCLGYEAAKAAGLDPLDATARRSAKKAAKAARVQL